MNIMLYSKKYCPQCSATKRKLDELGLEYHVINLEEHPAVLEDLRAQGFQQAPVVITEDDSWSGYRPDKLAALAARSPKAHAEESIFDNESVWA